MTDAGSGLTVPDYRGRFLLGGGHCAANHNTAGHDDGPHDANPGYPEGYFMGQGLKGGERRHQLSLGEMPRHDHDYQNFKGPDASPSPSVSTIPYMPTGGVLVYLIKPQQRTNWWLFWRQLFGIR